MSNCANAVPVFPDELFAADFPHWVKMVWVAVRKSQDMNIPRAVSLRFLADTCGMDRSQVGRAIGWLVREGWMTRTMDEFGISLLRCYVPEGAPLPRSLQPGYWTTRRPESGRSTPSGWTETRMAVFTRDNFTCQYCGAAGVPLECDHILPVSRGGSDDLSNLTTACAPCNQSKNNKTVEEWRTAR